MKPSVLPSRSKMVRLHAAHVLSMDVVLSIGLEMGSHSSDCWKHVFRYVCISFRGGSKISGEGGGGALNLDGLSLQLLITTPYHGLRALGGGGVRWVHHPGSAYVIDCIK